MNTSLKVALFHTLALFGAGKTLAADEWPASQLCMVPFEGLDATSLAGLTSADVAAACNMIEDPRLSDCWENSVIVIGWLGTDPGVAFFERILARDSEELVVCRSA